MMRKLYLLGLFLWLCSEFSHSTGFGLPNQNAFATARGNAFVATADNASAVYYNSAGMVQLSDPQLELGAYLIDFKVDFDSDNSGGKRVSSDQSPQGVPQLFGVLPLDNKFSLGLGLYSPFGLGNEWPDNSGFRTITRKARVVYTNLTPVLAYSVSDKLSIGAGLTANYIKIDLQQGLGLQADDYLRYAGSDYAFGYSLSTLWKPTEKHAFGLSYRSAVDHSLIGVSTVKTTDLPANLGRRNSGLAIEIPQLISAGYSYRPSAKWNLEFNLEWGGWDSVDRLRVTNTVLSDTVGDIDSHFDWHNGYIYQFGATRYLTNDRGNYALSIGYDYNQSVQPSRYYNPAVSDADRHWFNIGLAKLSSQRPWAIAYQYGTSDRDVVGSESPSGSGENADGHYAVTAHTISLSLGFNFLN